MLGVPLNQRIQRTLGVSLDDEMALTLDSKASPYFPAHLQQPSGEPSSSDISPRQGRPAFTLWVGPSLAQSLGPAHRVTVAGVEYELIADFREVTSGRATIGYRAPVLPVSELYPRTAEVWDLGGEDEPAAETVCSVFSLASRNAPRGDYNDAFGEAPATALAVLTGEQNRELRFDGETWRIRDASLQREVPFVALQLTKA